MVILDVAIVNVALPSIEVDLGFSQTSLQWVISAYAIMFGGALLLGGRLADLLGRRRLFLVGLGVFSLSSLLCGLAWSEGSLIAFRALQGLGGALLAPAALSLLMTTFADGRERNKALGIYGAASGSGAAAGVLLGGLLTSTLSWPWIFFINVPVGLAAIALTPCCCGRAAPSSTIAISTSQVRSRSRPGSCSSCTRSPGRRPTAGPRRPRSACWPARSRWWQPSS